MRSNSSMPGKFAVCHDARAQPLPHAICRNNHTKMHMQSTATMTRLHCERDTYKTDKHISFHDHTHTQTHNVHSVPFVRLHPAPHRHAYTCQLHHFNRATLNTHSAPRHLTTTSPNHRNQHAHYRNTALVMYLFTLDTNIQELVTQSTQAGSMCLNDTVMQYAGKTTTSNPQPTASDWRRAGPVQLLLSVYTFSSLLRVAGTVDCGTYCVHPNTLYTFPPVTNSIRT